jgi:AcrR family transcriptional regulator
MQDGSPGAGGPWDRDGPGSVRQGSPSSEWALRMQRARIVDAMTAVLAENGVRGATVAKVIARAEVSRSTFYRLFADPEQCLLAVREHLMGRVTRTILAAFEREASWPERVVTALAALLWLLDAEPPLARVCLVESLAGGPLVLRQRERELRALRPLIEAGSELAHPGVQPHALSAEATIASLAGILHSRMLTGPAAPFIELLGPLASMVLACHLDPRSEQVRSAEQLAKHAGRPNAWWLTPHGERVAHTLNAWRGLRTRW